MRAAGSAGAQETGASIQVYNRSFEPIEVRIMDTVCDDVLFEGQIFAESAVLVTACTNDHGKATIIVKNRAGETRSYSGLEKGSQVELETDRD